MITDKSIMMPKVTPPVVGLPYELLAQLSERRIKAITKLFGLLAKTTDEREHEEILRAIQELLTTGKRSRFVDPRVRSSREVIAQVRDYRKKVGQAIHHRRRDLDITQEALAKLTGIQQSHLSRLESGEHVPTSQTLALIARALEIDPSQLDPSFPKQPLLSGAARKGQKPHHRSPSRN